MLIDIDKIRVQNRIRKDFGDIQELADDIKENGLINPPVVIPEEDGTFTLLAGERRLRAMKSLGYQQVEVRTWKNLSDEEKLNVEISENEVRKDFSKAERIEYARRLEKIEAAKAKERQKESQFGSNMVPQNFGEPKSKRETVNIVASKLGIGSGETYRKEKFIVDNYSSLTPEDFADWDEGKLSTNKAFNRIKEKLKAAEEKNQAQERKLSSAQNLVADYKKDNTQLQQRLDQVNVDNRKLRSENETLKQQRTETVIKEVQVENPETLKKIKELETELKAKKADNVKLADDLIEAHGKLSQAMGINTNFQLVSHCSEITLKMLTFVKEMSQYDYMSESFNEIPTATRSEYRRCVLSVYKWADRILKTINEKDEEYEAQNVVIDVE